MVPAGTGTGRGFFFDMVAIIESHAFVASNLFAMRIREATIDDVPAMTDILNWAISETNAIFRAHTATVEERQEFFHRLESGGYPQLVAVDDADTVLGFAHYKPLGDPVVWIGSMENTVYVSPDAHGQGAGYALMKELIERARRDERCHTMVAKIVDDNEPSLRLHYKLGFELKGVLQEVSRKFGEWVNLAYLQLAC